jgi:DNA polymerase III epsilon subunit-like protein
MLILCFDTETTGLPQGRHISIYETEKWPHIVQISFMIYNTETKEVVQEYDEIVKIGEHVDLTPKSVEIHGITREIIEKRGIPITEALCAFKRALQMSDCSIGHNLSFDKRLLIVESIRNKGFDVNDDSVVQLHFSKEFCTMLQSVDVCKIKMFRKDGTTYYKYPTLLELHEHLFKIKPHNAHNSKVDVLICLRCYCKLAFSYDLSRESRQFRKMYREFCTMPSLS